MGLLLVVFVLLILFPVIVTSVFRESFITRKQDGVVDELKGLQALGTDLVTKGWGGEAGIREEIARNYSQTSLLVPALLLTAMYAFGFTLCWLYLNVTLGHGSPWPLPGEFVLASRSVLMTFVGAYLFNMSMAVRRIYLADLTENIFWSGLNRLLLAIGLAVVIRAGTSFRDDLFFFGIGLVTNVILGWAIELALRAPNLVKPTAPDLPLQMVQGINIWKEHRLEEEGIENVQNLATADVIELAVKTHYSMRTLMDWVDQAILLARLGEGARTLMSKGLVSGAIDLAWKAPDNSDDGEAASRIAKVLQIEDPHFVEDLMNSLFQDEHVRTLWRLWQARLDARPVGGASLSQA